MYTELESFDYDTSDSIEEEEEEEEEEETKGPPSDKDTNSMTKPKKSSAIDHNSPRREFRGRSVGGRDSIISNFSLESSLGGIHYLTLKQFRVIIVFIWLRGSYILVL